MTILYPFSITEDNKDSYLNTMLIAKEINAKVICFTSVKNDDLVDDAFLHLLDLNGYYQTIQNNWQVLNIQTILKIEIGDFEEKLKEIIKNNPINQMVCTNDLKTNFSKNIDTSMELICFDENSQT